MFNYHKSLDSILGSFNKTLAKLDAYVTKTEALVQHKFGLADAHDKEADRLAQEAVEHRNDITKAINTRAKIADLIGA